MSKAIILSALVASLLASFVAQAADTTELKVKGTIRPAACSPVFAGGGVVDYGTIRASSLPAGQNKVLDKKQISLSVNCDAPTKVGIKLADNRAASKVTGIVSGISANSDERFNFGLGTVSGKQVGGYALTMDPSTTADGGAVTNIYTTTIGSTWGAAAGLDSIGVFSFAQNGQNTPVSLTSLNLKINVQAVLNKPENLPLTQEVPLDGSATIEVIYM